MTIELDPRLHSDMVKVLDAHPFDHPGTGDPAALIAWMREDHEARVRRMTPPSDRDPVAATHDVDLPGLGGVAVRARIYEPFADAGGVLVWLHGGGWVSGSLETGDVAARAFCNRTGLRVLSVDYHLAPEHPWPAALQDTACAVQHALDRVEAGDWTGPVVLGGDSAGGNLAAATASVPELGDRLGGQLLAYPATVLTGALHESRRTFASGYGLEHDATELAIALYVPDEANRLHPTVSPGRARPLPSAPPAIVVTCGFDPMRDEGEQYAAMLADAGVPTDLVQLPGMLHGCFDMSGQSPAADETLTLVAGRLRALLDRREAS